MRKRLVSHIRKTLDLFEWIDREHPDASLALRTNQLGRWEELKPHWKRMGERILLRLEATGGELRIWIISSTTTSFGARLILSKTANSLPETLDISLPGKGHEDESKPHHLTEVVNAWIRAHYPMSRILSAVRRSDRRHSISGSFLRVRVVAGRRECLLAVSDGVDPGKNPSSLLTCALLWLSSLEKQNGIDAPSDICLLVPEDSSPALYHRARLVNSHLLRITIWEYQLADDGVYRFRKAPPPPPPIENRDFRWPILGPFHWSAPLGRILDLAPDFIRRYPRFDDYDSLRLWGLEFARVMGPERDHVCFGVGSQKIDLGDDNFDCLRKLVEEILYYRRPDSPCSRHPYYQMQSERWLESLILENVRRLFPELFPEAVYSQIPVYLSTDAGRVDILGIDQDGTLAVMELKTAEDPELPIQAVDYWGRVVLHNEHGDFERRGYFSGIPVNRRPPRIYLVSPVFGFHDSTERLLRYFMPGVEAWKIAINEDWRSGVKVLRRTRLQCGSSE